MSNQIPDLYNGTTTILNISGEKIDDKCTNVLNFFKKNKINCNIIPSKTIIDNNNKIEIENSCRITICGLNTKYIGNKVWYPLEKKFNLDCCHLEIPGFYSGCIKNFLAPSLCGINL